MRCGITLRSVYFLLELVCIDRNLTPWAPKAFVATHFSRDAIPAFGGVVETLSLSVSHCVTVSVTRQSFGAGSLFVSFFWLCVCRDER